MANARPFSISTLQELSNDTKNTSMQGVLGLVVELQKFRSPGGLQIPNFGSVGLHPHTWPKWGCDRVGQGQLGKSTQKVQGFYGQVLTKCEIPSGKRNVVEHQELPVA
jgi:hypothetical protein